MHVMSLTDVVTPRGVWNRPAIVGGKHDQSVVQHAFGLANDSAAKSLSANENTPYKIRM